MSADLRCLDRRRRFASRLRRASLQVIIRSTMSQPDAKAQGLQQITRCYENTDVAELKAIKAAYDDLPPDDRFIVTHGRTKLAIWRRK